MKKKVVIYARFSSHGQTEQSIEGQLRECYDYARRQDYVVVEEYIDRAISGTIDKRPEFLRMIEDSKKKTFEYVLVYQLDRFARNRYDSANYKAKLKKNGIRVLSAKENITDDASGILIEGLLESMAEYYSVELSQKVKRGVKESLIKGHFIGGHKILGYDIIDKKWVINDEEAEVVRYIFLKYNGGMKTNAIMADLNSRGIKGKGGRIFKYNTIAQMIRNPKYIGKLCVNGVNYDNVIPPIISLSLFEQCNKLMDNSKHMARPVKSKDNPYALSGKLYCGQCGALVTAESGTSKSGRVYQYYKCVTLKKRQGYCSTKGISKDKLESLVYKATVEYVLQPHIIESLSVSVANRFNAAIKKSMELISLESSLNATEKSINGLLTALENGICTQSTKDRLLKLESQKSETLEKMMKTSARQIQPIEVSVVRDFINHFVQTAKDGDANVNVFVGSFINKVVLYDKKIAVVYNTTADCEYDIELSSDDYLCEDSYDDKQVMKNMPDTNRVSFYDWQSSSHTYLDDENLVQINEKCPSEQLVFERALIGGGRGIRTPAPVKTNGFQDRLVMTTSIFLRNDYDSIANL